MKIWAYIFGGIAVTLLCLCTIQPVKKSRVINFQYGGYGDTAYASFGGGIFRSDSSLRAKDSLIALPGVTIQVKENNRKVVTDSKGQFVIWFQKGVFTLLVTKNGYQPLRIENYNADPDQFSGITICLEKGTQLQVYRIPDKPNP